ncbi:MAG TPA: asparaginase [Candidatus Limnocylindrales bacterium]|nr:asparaginase [Candidatus Limnocylindrales bacterium]
MGRVAIVFTGGTISTLPDQAAGGNLPVLDGAQILARSPEVAQIAQVETIDWGLVPASHLRFAQLIDIAAVVDRALARPEIDGAVVVQGTDTIEETAYAYELLVRSGKPLIVTGAMRDAAAPDFDGPRNLADAVRCALAPELRGSGVQVVLNGLVVAARDVVKSHSTALDTFKPRDGAATGRVVGGRVLFDGEPRPRRRLPSTPPAAVEDVHLVTAVTGMDGAIVRALRPSRPAGLVVAATGSGNTSPDLLAAASELTSDGTVVALSTRCPSGTVAPMYAFAGGGARWQQAGALMSALDGPKTRVALALGLAAGLDRAALAALLAGEPA